MARWPGAGDLVLSCEHGGAAVPAAYRALFAGADKLLATHRGSDLGALVAARQLARLFGAPLWPATVTRLLVDLNRSPHHPRVFSSRTAELPPAARAALLARHHAPHRARVAAAVAAGVARRRRRDPPLVHVCVHSFTPRLAGQVRQADVGLLYDPSRLGERTLCLAWRRALAASRPDLVVRLNYPYRGRSDGLATVLRRRHGAGAYVGIELELNQAWWRRGAGPWRALVAAVGAALLAARAETLAEGARRASLRLKV